MLRPFPQFHSLFFELWKNCGTVEIKAQKPSTTVVVCINILLWGNGVTVEVWGK